MADIAGGKLTGSRFKDVDLADTEVRNVDLPNGRLRGVAFVEARSVAWSRST
ncbi:hypothetical protein ABN028_08805 [Actinopolymorpha sp. B17G11]|uniref:hypothetical protein n=1 Tax=unclassified Actinopolymorpha TaxID=2627063 RepID=UPI0032D95027